MTKKKRLIISALAVLAILLIIALFYHRVNNSLTAEDLQYIPKYLTEKNISAPIELSNYEEELNFIGQVQEAVLEVAPENRGIPYNKKREPMDLYLAKGGLCYDRSRAIEKILRYGGLRTRHVALYSTGKTNSVLKSMLTRGVSSHAVTEVQTARGWLVIDSNSPWLSLDLKGNPISIRQIRSAVRGSSISWRQPLPSSIFKEPFAIVYGLYSRHGRFYPPYNPIPDINYREFISNIF